MKIYLPQDAPVLQEAVAPLDADGMSGSLPKSRNASRSSAPSRSRLTMRYVTQANPRQSSNPSKPSCPPSFPNPTHPTRRPARTHWQYLTYTAWNYHQMRRSLGWGAVVLVRMGG